MIGFLSRKETPPPREPKALQLARELSRRPRILFVEDSQLLRDFFLRVIPERFCVEMIGAESVAAAREALARDEFFAAILDYRLTNGSGVQLYRELTETRPQTKVVFLTGYENSELRRQVEQIGPATIFTKDSVSDLSFMEKLFAQFGIRKKAGATNCLSTPQVA